MSYVKFVEKEIYINLHFPFDALDFWYKIKVAMRQHVTISYNQIWNGFIRT